MKRTVDPEATAEAQDWLDSMRRDVIDACTNIQFDVERYKRAASDAAAYGAVVPFTDTLKAAMEDAMRSLASLNEHSGEWSTR